MFNGVGPMELVIILLVVLLLFGGKKIPEIAKSIAQGIQEFKKAGKEVTGSENSGSAKKVADEKDTNSNKS